MNRIDVEVVGMAEIKPSPGSAGLMSQLPGQSATVSSLGNSGTGILESWRV